jgi:hypothetical protein
MDLEDEEPDTKIKKKNGKKQKKGLTIRSRINKAAEGLSDIEPEVQKWKDVQKRKAGSDSRSDVGRGAR